METVRTMLADAMDLGSLPAGQTDRIGAVVSEYARLRESEHAWMLGRLLCSVDQLGAIEKAARGMLPTERSADPWRLSASVPADRLKQGVESIFAFNQHHEEEVGAGRIVVDSLDIRVTSASADGANLIDRAMNAVPEQLDAYFELPLGYDLRGLVTALAGTGGRAKVRTGGPSADHVPTSAVLADFVETCRSADVAFKVGLGLPAAMRCSEPAAHGFLNFLVAASLLKMARLPKHEAVDLLEADGADAFRFEPGELTAAERTLSVGQLASAREAFVVSFAVEDFGGAVESLRRLDLLPTPRPN